MSVQGLWSISDPGALIDAVYARGQRFERALHYYWSTALGLPEAEARRRTVLELGELANELRASAGDPCVFAVTIPDQPVGMFSLRPASSHPRGRMIGEIVASEPTLRARYPGSHGLAHAVALLDQYASIPRLRELFYLLACRALQDRFDHVFFYSSDLRLRALYQRFGIEFPDALRFADSQHLVGAYTPRAQANVETLARTAQHLSFRSHRA